MFREQRSSSEDSVTKLLQSNPVGVYDSDDEDGFAISKEAYVRMNNYKSEYQSSHLSEQLEVKVSILTFYITMCCVSPSFSNNSYPSYQ